MTVPGSPSPLPVPALHIVLYQPEIPQNTGNVGRTCLALGAKLWIVRPTGFRLDSAHLKRAGMDYWRELDWEPVDGWQQLIQRLPIDRMWMVTKFGSRAHCDVEYRPGDALVLGRESSGLPASLLDGRADRRLAIPMPGGARSLNLATAAAIVAYEAARQLGLLKALPAGSAPA